MRSRHLEAALREFVEEASSRLQAELLDGAEVPFELASHASRRGQAPLYCYRPLTAEFLKERSAMIAALPSHAPARSMLESFHGLDRYLLGSDAPRVSAKGRARIALMTLLEDVFCEQTDFVLSSERLDGALARLDRSECAAAGEVTVVATLHGLTISSPELSLTRNLLIAQPEALDGAPEQAVSPSWLTLGAGWNGSSEERGGGGEAPHLIALFTIEQAEAPHEAIAQGRQVLRALLRALRLFGDGRIAFGPLAWARAGEGPWIPMAPGWGGRPHGMLLVGTEHEDELRAFCNLIARRAPEQNELAWALRRFELGCERPGEYEALSDYLLALRALLEPEGGSDGLLASRLAALCATHERRAELAERVLEAIALERSVVDGEAHDRGRGIALVREMSAHLRALLRDVVCGHLNADLIAVADELLLSPAADAPSAVREELSGEEMVEQESQSGEILDVVV